MKNHENNEINMQIPTRNDNDFIQSASVTAMMRALLAGEEGALKNPDYIAKYYVTEPWKSFLEFPKKSRENLEKRVPGCMSYHLVRTKKIDQILTKWAKNNPSGQILILGSGLDSRSIRMAGVLHDIKIYEFDLKGMFNHKKKVLKSNKILKESFNVTYVPINFHNDSLSETFHNIRLKQNIPTFILWEGVTYFLEEKTVYSTFENLSNYFTNALNIVFDYAYKDYINGNLDYYGASELAKELKMIGEPHLFGINPKEMEKYLHKLKFKIMENSTAEDLEGQFLVENDNLISRIHGFHGIVYCEKD